MIFIEITSCPDFETLKVRNSPLITLLQELFSIMSPLGFDADTGYLSVIDDLLTKQGVKLIISFDH